MSIDVWIARENGPGYLMGCQDGQCDECPLASSCWQVGGAA